MKKISILSLLCFTLQISFAQITFTSSQSGDWNLGTTWDLTGCAAGCIAGVDYPSAIDDANIAPSHTVTVTADHDANSVSFQADASGTSGFIINTGQTLTVTNNFTTVVTQSGSILTFTVDGTLVVNGNFTNSINNDFTIATHSFNSGSTVTLNGTNNRFTMMGNGDNSSLDVIMDGTVNCASALGFLILSGNTNTAVTVTVNNMLTTNGLLLQNAAATNSDLTLDINSTLDCNGSVTLLRTGGLPTDLAIDMTTAGAEFKLSGSLSSTVNAVVLADATNSSRFVYDGSSGQTIHNHGNIEYHDLVIENTTGASLGAALAANNVKGDIIIENGGVFAAGIHNVTHDGNWIENGTGSFTQSSGTVTFNGTGLQTITGTVNFPNDVIITNTNASGVVLDAASTVTFETLTINTNGVFKSNGADFSISGDISNAGIFTPSNDDVVTFSGSGVQTISGTNPIAFQDVVIANSVGVNTPTGSDVTFEDLTINSGAILDIDDETIYVTGNWTNNHGIAGFTPSTSGEVVFSGSTTQTIGGSDTTTFKDLTISNTFGTAPQVTVSTAINIEEVLDVTDGQLDANGNVTLVSNAAGTGVLADLSNGTPENPPIVGNLTTERYVNEGNPYFYMLASPMTNTFLEDWDDDVYSTGIVNSDDPSYGLVSISSWDETGCASPTPTDMTTQSHNNGSDQSGWFVYSVSDTTFDVTGTPRIGSVTMNGLTLGAGCAQGDGWHLLGNPYAAHVAWDDVFVDLISGANGGSAYVLQNDGSGNYIEYDHMTPSNILASGEAFWVQVGAGTGTVAFAESDKTGSAANDNYNSVRLYTNYRPTFKIDMEANADGRHDETRLQLREGASDGYEWFNETQKLGNINNKINIASVVDSINVLHNSIDYDADSLTFPIRLYRAQGSQSTVDSFAITFQNVSVFTECNKCLILEDTTQNISVRIDSTNQVHHTVMPDDGNPRLFLHIFSPLTITAQNPTCSGLSDGYISALGRGAGPFTYTWLNELLDTIQVTSGISSGDTLWSVMEGNYTVVVTNNGACGTVRALMTITSPLSVNNTSITETPVTCVNGNDGSAALHIDSIPSGMTFLWSNGALDTIITGLSAGTYTVSISDGMGCTITKTATILDGASKIQQLTSLPTNCFGDSTGSVSIHMVTNNLNYSFVWSTGDSTYYISGLGQGNYQFTVTETATGCQETGNYTITQPDPILIQPIIVSEACFGQESGVVSFQITGGSGSPYILLDNGSEGNLIDSLIARDYTVYVTDSLGCQTSADFTMTELLPITVGYSVSSDTVDLGEVVSFNNTSTNSNTYYWEFGNGDTSLNENPDYIYNVPGLYIVSLGASDSGNCQEVFVDSVFVTSILVNNQPFIQSKGIQISRVLNNIQIQTSFDTQKNVSVSMHNAAGQEMIQTIQKDIASGTIEVEIPLVSGAYFMTIKQGEDIIFYKIIK